MKKSKFLLLVKMQLMSWFGINSLIHSRPAASAPVLGQGWSAVPRTAAGRKMGFQSILSIIVIICFFWISYMYSNMIAQAMLLTGGSMTVVLSIMMMVASLLILITGVYSNGKTLFAFKDYDLVMSLPVSPFTVAASRIAVIYLYELLFTVLFMVPAYVVYVRYVEVSVLFYPVALICMLAVPLIPLIISTALGTLVTFVSFRAKRFGTAVNIVITMAFMAVVMVGSMSMNADTLAMASRIDSIGDTIASKYPPTAMFVKAVAEMDILSILTFLIISVAAFLVFCLLISNRYRRLCSRISSSPVKSREYRTGDIKSQPLLWSLYKREIRRYFSSTIYVTNTAVGLVLAVAFCIILLFPKGLTAQIMAAVSDEEGMNMIRTFAPLFLSILVAMSCTTGSSISMEGRHIWILKSLPLPAKHIFLCKLLVNLTLTVPVSIICGVLLSIALDIRGIQLVLTIAVPVVYALFSAVLGLLVNLKLPKLEWQNEAQIVKQSAASMISIFGSAALPTLIVLGAAALPNYLLLFTAGSLAIPIAAIIVIALYLSRRGESLFKAL
ncbi:MAG: hypothetical protein ACOX7I_03270 [Oscillospiraceae bacterium]|jgi:ABC-2 type transport system permease protein